MPRSCDAVEVDRNACERTARRGHGAPGTQLAAAVQGLGIVVPPGDTDAFAAAILTLAATRIYACRRTASTKVRGNASGYSVILDRFERTLLEVCGISEARNEDEPVQIEGVAAP